MPRLQFWPLKANNTLDLGDRTLHAGETWAASQEDAEELLTNPATAEQVREAPDAPAVESGYSKSYPEEAAAGGFSEAGTLGTDGTDAQPPSGTAKYTT